MAEEVYKPEGEEEEEEEDSNGEEGTGK